MNKINHWLVPEWPAPANIHAATTLRTGGVSQGVYSSLNPAAHVGDDIGLVEQNRQKIRDMLNLPSEPVWLEQIHSDRVVKAVKPTDSAPGKGDMKGGQQADASYTDEAGVVCVVMTADCLPLLVCTEDGTRVAAIHAGWRGLLAGVIGNTLSAVQNLDNSAPLCLESTRVDSDQISDPFLKQERGEKLLVWLGPAIGPDCFEVGSDVRDAFLEKSTEFNSAFKKQNNDKWLADIYQMARIELAKLGVTDIYGGTYCTVTEHERFYSYRREAQTGRMATLIWRD